MRTTTITYQSCHCRRLEVVLVLLLSIVVVTTAATTATATTIAGGVGAAGSTATTKPPPRKNVIALENNGRVLEKSSSVSSSFERERNAAVVSSSSAAIKAVDDKKKVTTTTKKDKIAQRRPLLQQQQQLFLRWQRQAHHEEEPMIQQLLLRVRGGSGSAAAVVATTTTKTKTTNNKNYSSRQQRQPRQRRRNHHHHPSFYWAVLHCWLYFLSLGFNATNIPFVVRGIVDGTTTNEKPSAKAIALSGHVEAVDRLLTFLGIGLLSALSDKFGRRPLIAWSALGFAATNLLQAKTQNSVPLLYLADFVDGCSSCMLPVCQAYVTDCSPPSKRAANLGVFQGLVVGAAFILAFPIGGILGAKLGPRVPLLIAAGLQLLNALIVAVVTPESNSNVVHGRAVSINWKESNPVGGLVRLFGHAPLLRVAAATYFLSCLGRSSLDAQFVNYSNLRFGWSQAQSGPVLCIVGLMLAIVPRLLVPRVGLQKSIVYGLLVTAASLVGVGLAPTSQLFVGGILCVSLGCVYSPALQALLANLAGPGERGALLGAASSLVELTAAIGSTMYASILGTFASSSDPPIPGVPGMHFLVGGGLFFMAWAVAFPGLAANRNDPALDAKDVDFTEVE